MLELPEQKAARRGREFVDTEMLGQKQNAKAFRAAAYTMGISIAFLILSGLLPTFEDKRVAEMMELIRGMAYWMMAYAVIIVFSYIKMRKQMSGVRFLLNWFLVPTVAVWFLLRVMDIYSTMPPEL